MNNSLNNVKIKMSASGSEVEAPKRIEAICEAMSAQADVMLELARSLGKSHVVINNPVGVKMGYSDE